MRLSRLIGAVENGEICFDGVWEREIEGLSSDSRKIKKGYLFFCLTGGSQDGHDYAAAAVKNGAAAIVVERKLPLNVPQLLVPDTRAALSLLACMFYGFPSERMKVVGITGTNGKTTTANMLYSIWRAQGKKAGVIGTLGVRFGEQIQPTSLTTPDPIDLQKTLAEMAASGVEYVAMEVSAHALYYKKTAGVRFAACIFTNFTQDHLDFFRSMREYEGAKTSLFTQTDCPLAVLNGDDKAGRRIGVARETKTAQNALLERKTVYYGLETPTEAFAIITDETLKGTECMLNISDRLCRVSLALTGRHNVYNALAAATCATALGADSRAVAKGLMDLKYVRGRLEYAGEFQGGDVFVDFAHTPDGLEKSLAALRLHCKGRLICLFGCGGNRDKSKRPLMGETAAKQCDFSVLTSDNPRYEDPLDILSEIEKGYRRFSMKYVVVPEREKAIYYALERLQKGDVLLVAGKGGEEYQEIMGIKYPFNDNDIIEKIRKEKFTH
ncbi:MAG: UDP-N-acetylmuramoyl-L-alanyl-D-glutamate--2,6-diaminopimelate ligase [Clostridia bacterium]|nr:UDP-N-acetylmuramoyl-L-alanyl-D-glutamate--2,6-diaminopimelate ligase [Clostridia bacterium]